MYIKIISLKNFLLYWENSGNMEKRHSLPIDTLHESISKTSQRMKKFRKKFGNIGKISKKRTRSSFSQI